MVDVPVVGCRADQRVSRSRGSMSSAILSTGFGRAAASNRRERSPCLRVGWPYDNPPFAVLEPAIREPPVLDAGTYRRRPTRYDGLGKLVADSGTSRAVHADRVGDHAADENRGSGGGRGPGPGVRIIWRAATGGGTAIRGRRRCVRRRRSNARPPRSGRPWRPGCARRASGRACRARSGPGRRARP